MGKMPNARTPMEKIPKERMPEGRVEKRRTPKEERHCRKLKKIPMEQGVFIPRRRKESRSGVDQNEWAYNDGNWWGTRNPTP